MLPCTASLRGGAGGRGLQLQAIPPPEGPPSALPVHRSAWVFAPTRLLTLVLTALLLSLQFFTSCLPHFTENAFKTKPLLVYTSNPLPSKGSIGMLLNSPLPGLCSTGREET